MENHHHYGNVKRKSNLLKSKENQEYYCRKQKLIIQKGNQDIKVRSLVKKFRTRIQRCIKGNSQERSR